MHVLKISKKKVANSETEYHIQNHVNVDFICLEKFPAEAGIFFLFQKYLSFVVI